MKTLASQKASNFTNRLVSTSALSTLWLVTVPEITNYSAKCTSQHVLATKVYSKKTKPNYLHGAESCLRT